MSENFNKKLIGILKTDVRFVDDEGELIKAAVIDHAWKIDRDLVKLLLSHSEVKNKFFVEIEGHWIFNINIFIDYISDKNFLADSYTRFRNKIGLNIGGKFLRERGEVSLVWPYKDCVLEGGQAKEEEKRKENFFNEILAQDEIDRLFDPKVLTNWKRYTANGEQNVTEIRRDENGTIKENLIIKGNNLLALHTLKTQFRGKVKLIYIDPPYNTGFDSFKYNDSFNHSSWLTFMHNRLEVAKTLLSDDGIIMINLDDNEFAYLNIICDQVFHRKNFICNFLWKKKSTSTNVEGVQVSPLCDYILTYAKSASGRIKQRVRYKETRTYPNNDEIGNYRTAIIEKKDAGGYKRDTMKFEILGRKPRDTKRWQIGEKTARELEKKNRFFIDENGIVKLKIYDFEDKDTYSANPSLLENHGSSDSASKHVNNDLFGIPELFSNPKPEELITFFIENSTEENDIVLDFFAGSGTTLAVAMKMKRKFIACEQMDYCKTVTVERLKKVIEGEQGGISKSVNWQGGGDFIYCELMKYNEVFMDKIQAAETSEELVDLWKDIAENSFLNWYVNPEAPEDAVNDFIAIGTSENGLDKQKKLLSEMLNKNQLYVNLSEIDDADFGVSAEDKSFNRSFYGEAYNG